MLPTRRHILAGAACLAVGALSRTVIGAESAPLKAAIIGHTGRGDYGHGMDICFTNIPGVYAVIVPVNADAATVNGDASHNFPGPERPL